MLLGEKYRLELHWEKAIFNKDNVCDLKGAYFSGPVLHNAEKINDNDHIMLDFFHQYFILVKSIYVGKLSWKKVIYNNDVVLLESAKISHDKELNRVPKLLDSDYLVIDTKGHDIEEHYLNLVYKTYVVNEDKNPYNFRNKK